MRISADRSKASFHPMAPYISVLLDDLLQHRVLEADDEFGWVLLHVEDDEGGFAEATLRGKVKFLLAFEGMAALRPPNSLRTSQWLTACGKEPNAANLSTQIGVHIEEFTEFLEQVVVPETAVHEGDYLNLAVQRLLSVADSFKSGAVQASLGDPEKALDALCDCDVTGNGVAFLAGWNKMLADSKVLDANDRKLVDGKPVTLPGGKIGKPEGWVAADLSDCV